MRGGLIDYLWTGVKATYIAIFATSFATVRSSYNTVLLHIPTAAEAVFVMGMFSRRILLFESQDIFAGAMHP